ALETLRRHAATRKAIYLITDGQAEGWKQFDDIRKVLTDPAATSHVILVGGPEEHNLCVSDLRLASAMAAIGEASQFEVEVSNFGSGETKDVPVKLSIDGEPPS